MKRQLITFILIFISALCLSQTDIHLTRGEKKSTIVIGKTIELATSHIGTDKDSTMTGFEGDLIGVFGDSIKIKPFRIIENTYTVDKKNLIIEKQFVNDTSTTISLHINEIRKIRKIHTGFQDAAIRVSAVSLITALVVSPLVSINYNKGTFNKNRYALITGISLATFTTSLTLSLKFGYREYKTKDSKRNWSFEK